MYKNGVDRLSLLLNITPPELDEYIRDDNLTDIEYLTDSIFNCGSVADKYYLKEIELKSVNGEYDLLGSYYKSYQFIKENIKGEYSLGIITINNFKRVHFHLNKVLIYNNEIANTINLLPHIGILYYKLSYLEIYYDFDYSKDLIKRINRLVGNPNNFIICNRKELQAYDEYSKNYLDQYRTKVPTYYFPSNTDESNTKHMLPTQLVIYNKSVYNDKKKEKIIGYHLNNFSSTNVWRFEIKYRLKNNVDDKPINKIDIYKLDDGKYCEYLFNEQYIKQLDIRKKDNNYPKNKNRCKKINLIKMNASPVKYQMIYKPKPIVNKDTTTNKNKVNKQLNDLLNIDTTLDKLNPKIALYGLDKLNVDMMINKLEKYRDNN